MMVARWHVDARFGHKQAVLAMMARWWRDIAPQVGWNVLQARMLSGSLGEAESAVQVEVEIADLAALDSAWSRLANVPEQARWSAELEPLVISGSSRWTIYRKVPLAA